MWIIPSQLCPDRFKALAHAASCAGEEGEIGRRFVIEMRLLIGSIGRLERRRELVVVRRRRRCRCSLLAFLVNRVRDAGSVNSSVTDLFAPNLALRNPSLDVFSSNRRTRYAIPGTSSPIGQYSRTRYPSLTRARRIGRRHSVQHLEFIVAGHECRVSGRKSLLGQCCVRCGTQKPGKRSLDYPGASGLSAHSWRRSPVLKDRRELPMFFAQQPPSRNPSRHPFTRRIVNRRPWWRAQWSIFFVSAESRADKPG